MVDEMTPYDRINVRRQVNYIRRIVEQAISYHVMAPNDLISKGRIRDMIDSAISTVPGCRMTPTREDRRKDMSDSDKIIDILEEELTFDGFKDTMDFSIELTPIKAADKIHIDFKIN